MTIKHLLEHTSGLQPDAFRNGVVVKQAFDQAGHPVKSIHRIRVATSSSPNNRRGDVIEQLEILTGAGGLSEGRRFESRTSYTVQSKCK